MERWREELYYNSLMHYGIPGMRKGRRRFTNADGTLNAAGERRYSDQKAGSSQQSSSGSAQGENQVATSTRQRESLESGERNRRVAAANRSGHMQRVQDVVAEKQEKASDKSEETRPVNQVPKQNPAVSNTRSANQNKSQNKGPAKPASAQAQGAVAGVKPILDKREAERQRLLERAEREREANRKGLTANPDKVQTKKDTGNAKKKKTVDDFKKKGERYVAKKTR